MRRESLWRVEEIGSDLHRLDHTLTLGLHPCCGTDTALPARIWCGVQLSPSINSFIQAMTQSMIQ